MSKVSIEEKLLLEFNSPNLVVTEELSAQFKFRPDLLLKNENTVRAFIIRKTHAIPFDFIDRFSENTHVENCVVEKYIAFANKPATATIDKCVSEKRIAICYPHRGKIITVLPKGGFAAPVAIVVALPVYEMPHTVIFISSIEEIQERAAGEKIIQRINAKYKKAIFGNRVERDKLQKTMTKQELWKEITKRINDDEYFLGILTEEHSGAVEAEIQIAMNIKEYDKLILLIKDNEQTREAWKDLLFDIHMRIETRGKTAWYTKYDDIDDFEDTLRKEVMELISSKYKENGSTFL